MDRITPVAYETWEFFVSWWLYALSVHVRPWPIGGGETGELVRNFDWSSTSLGPISAWPQNLQDQGQLDRQLADPAGSDVGRRSCDDLQ
jgi:hypothetical protein